MSSHGNKSELQAHCRRVAALAAEISRRIGLAPGEQQLVKQAAWLHHQPPELLDLNTLDRLATEMAKGNPQGLYRAGPAARKQLEELRNVLLILHSHSTLITDQRLFTLADIVSTSNYFAESMEASSGEPGLRERIIRKLNLKAEEGLCRPAVFQILANLPRIQTEQLPEVVSKLPVYAAVALKVLALAAHEEVSFRQLETLISADQVLAGRLIHVANSWAYSPRHSISTIHLAISYIGIEATRKVLTAVSFQPLFASASLRDLWKHSIEVARECERLAAASGRFHEEEAFLAGLVHDVGRLAISKLAGDAAVTYARLVGDGCEPVFAEQFLCGFDHGVAGAEILRRWNFPVHLIDAVEHHEHPEKSQSDLASLLYLAESRNGAAESAACGPRLQQAMDKVRIKPDLFQSENGEIGVLSCLMNVA